MSVKVDYIESFALITLDREKQLNALSFEVLRTLDEIMSKLEAREDLRALLITGTGERAFCAGADIPELMNRKLVDQLDGAELGQAVFNRLENLPIPSIALINGFALGGGLELALACTFRLCSEKAKFALPEIKLGLIPGYGGTQRLPRVIGQARAMEMILTGKMIDAAHALDYGLVLEVLEPARLMDRGLELARDLAQYSRPAARFARRAVQHALDLPLEEGLKMEAYLSTLAYRCEDAEEGMQAFLERRTPEFNDV